ncbi:hypothetical protein SARC_04436 [Sphaeroforma arctica JP610]|uniref:Uncharacterized protein n=1 Tax=Sphaeroforma arctica JP610 TaxID=667725 RepID=A0A0L0G395_9EUKA|nr:hypothetical protein SARC_04436 [Sphaeroforma arctica JP610]KNC83311.1 hypothetical protein SARC_04436 [Sphaeroforma arctica JP610]|eukprot:XP_014157213.1 hypothetical protein SARC_04436 [Sphaeroforma arctica JP610]
MFTTPIDCPKKYLERQRYTSSHSSTRSWENHVANTRKHAPLGSRDSGYESCLDLKKQCSFAPVPLKASSDCIENTFSASKKPNSFEDPEQLGFCYNNTAKRKTELPNYETNLTASEAADRLRFMRHYSSLRWKR